MTALALAALAAAAGAGPGTPPAGAAAETAAPARVETALMAEMNRVRARHGRRALRPAPALARPARAHSRYLMTRGVLEHEGPGGTPFWKRLVAAGYPANRFMGENLAMIPGCSAAAARATVRMWMASPGHRANLLNPRYRFAGAGAASDAACAATILTADYGS